MSHPRPRGQEEGDVVRQKLRPLQLLRLLAPGKVPRLIPALSWAHGFYVRQPVGGREVAAGVIPPADKEKVDKLTLDQTATKLFHVIGQALVLGSSLAVRSREAGEQASLQEGRVASMETEVAHLQKLAADFEQQLAESRAREQQALDELAKAKGDRDSLADHLGKSGALVNELREALNKAKESAVEEFKSSSEFMVVVEDAASKYFGEGFDFCKVQLQRHHPELAIDLEGTVVDQDLLADADHDMAIRIVWMYGDRDDFLERFGVIGFSGICQGEGQSTTIKSCHTVVWWGSVPRVIVTPRNPAYADRGHVMADGSPAKANLP
ncbi:hypothetical protein Acr_11g0010620 [Actinidia rufa]|uniref:Uncharacterized protein n=1 Tax=Actinidia rufa TaxID=165716 RepID=A0A7J0FE91_9ERIC|nr:hypothetical protein Acr_11g0010620 [Actinidia rufa]